MIEALRFVADFLNAIGPTMTREQWRSYLKRHVRIQRVKGEGLILGPLVEWNGAGRMVASVTLREAKQIRQNVTSALRYLDFDRRGIRFPSDPVNPGEQLFGRTGEHPFGPLMMRLTETFKPAGWRCISLGSTMPEPGQAILRLKRQDGRVERWAASYSPFGQVRTLQEWIYAMLGKALLSGLLGQFRMCAVCARYFVAWGKAAKRINCSDNCKNKRGALNVAARVRRSRADKRERMLDRARAMVKEGKSPRMIKQAVQLPERVLEGLFMEMAVEE